MGDLEIRISILGAGAEGRGTWFEVPESALRAAAGNQAELEELVERFFLPALAILLHSTYPN